MIYVTIMEYTVIFCIARVMIVAPTSSPIKVQAAWSLWRSSTFPSRAQRAPCLPCSTFKTWTRKPWMKTIMSWTPFTRTASREGSIILLHRFTCDWITKEANFHVVYDKISNILDLHRRSESRVAASLATSHQFTSSFLWGVCMFSYCVPGFSLGT